MSMRRIFEEESEKLDQKLLDLEMNLILNGWSIKIAHKVFDLRREVEEFNKFAKMAKDFGDDCDTEEDPSEIQLAESNKKKDEVEPDYTI